MKPIIISSLQGLTIEIKFATTEEGHHFIANAKPQAITEILHGAMKQIVELGEDDERGYKE